MTKCVDISDVDTASPRRTPSRADRLRDFDDAALIRLARGGGARSRAAFAELWTRHLPAALVAARRITGSFEPADLASEAFARVLSAMRAGRGPELSFRAYLIVTMRNVAASWARQASRLAVFELDDPDALPHLSSDLDRLDRLAGFEVFRSLPERWRRVLWYSEVEHLSPVELGELFGISASAAAMLAFRARQGLRKAWLSCGDTDGPKGAVVRAPRHRIGL